MLSTDVNTVKTERGDYPEVETILKLNRAEFEREMLYNRNSRQAVRDHMNKRRQDRFNEILLSKEKRSRLILEHLDINLSNNCNNFPIEDIKEEPVNVLVDSSNVTADIIDYLSQKLDHFLICIDANCSLLIKNSTGNQEQPLVDNITEETINYL